MPETPAPVPSITPPSLSELTGRERALLDFAGRLYTRANGQRDRDALEAFGLTMTRYLQLLHHLIDRADALAYAPAIVRRLQRLRAQRKRPWRSST